MPNTPNFAQHLRPFHNLFQAFKNANKQLYAVGGCARDLLLNFTPKDFDFTTDATPPEIKQILHNQNLKAIPVGEDFGTIATLIANKTYEITTYRVKESYQKTSRHPNVAFGHSLIKDLERRDLTINAIAISENGELIDPFNGQQDLITKTLKVPDSSPNKSIEIFSNDPLRMLRIARFKARLNFNIHPDAHTAAIHCADQILYISRERWKLELDALLNHHGAPDALNWLIEVGILKLILPELHTLSQTTQWNKTLNIIQKTKPDTSIKWAALLNNLTFNLLDNNHETQAILQQLLADQILIRFKTPNKQKLKILNLLTPFPNLNTPPNYKNTRSIAIQLKQDIQPWLDLNHTKATLQPEKFEHWKQWNNALQHYIDNPQAIPITLPPQLAETIQNQLNINGKKLGDTLKFLEEAILDQHIAENDPLEKFISYARKILAPH